MFEFNSEVSIILNLFNPRCPPIYLHTNPGGTSSSLNYVINVIIVQGVLMSNTGCWGWFINISDSFQYYQFHLWLLDNFFQRNLDIENGDEQGLIVRQFQLLNWSKHDELPPAYGDILDLFDQIQRWQQQRNRSSSAQEHIIVHCLWVLNVKYIHTLLTYLCIVRRSWRDEYNPIHRQDKSCAPPPSFMVENIFSPPHTTVHKNIHFPYSSVYIFYLIRISCFPSMTIFGMTYSEIKDALELSHTYIDIQLQLYVNMIWIDTSVIKVYLHLIKHFPSGMSYGMVWFFFFFSLWFPEDTHDWEQILFLLLTAFWFFVHIYHMEINLSGSIWRWHGSSHRGQVKSRPQNILN